MKRGRGKSKIEELEKRAEEAEARLQANLARRNELGSEGRALEIERRQGVGVVRRLEIEERLKQVVAELRALDIEADRLSREAMVTRGEFTEARRRLRAAQRALDVIANPPPWGLRGDGGELSPATIRALEQQARKTVKELT